MNTVQKSGMTGILTVLLLAAGAANAHLIHIDSFQLSGTLTNPESEAAWIETIQGLDAGSLTYLNKLDLDEGWDDTGVADAAWFDVDFTHFKDGDEDEPVAGELEWDLTGTGYQLSYMLVKAGQASYNLYGVTDEQIFRNTGPAAEYFDQGGQNVSSAISHLSFYGRGSTSVPDGGFTLALLGIGIAGVGLLKRKISN